jgi:hypothetical protein
MLVTVSWALTPVQLLFGHPATAADTVAGAVKSTGLW